MKTALVTGATRGIGLAIAQVLETQGYRLLLTGTQQSVVAELNARKQANRQYICADFAEECDIAALEQIISDLPRLDLCVNCAGINIIKEIGEVSDDDLNRILDVNYKAAYRISRQSSQVMKRCGSGRIVNIASIWSVIAKPGRTLYCGSKAALVGMSRALAAELAPEGILVNCVSPGFVMTDLTRKSLSESELQALQDKVPMQRFAQPEEIAKIVSFLGGPDNTYLTGQNIVVDGGFSIV